MTLHMIRVLLVERICHSYEHNTLAARLMKVVHATQLLFLFTQKYLYTFFVCAELLRAKAPKRINVRQKGERARLQIIAMLVACVQLI